MGQSVTESIGRAAELAVGGVGGTTAASHSAGSGELCGTTSIVEDDTCWWNGCCFLFFLKLLSSLALFSPFHRFFRFCRVFWQSRPVVMVLFVGVYFSLL